MMYIVMMKSTNTILYRCVDDAEAEAYMDANGLDWVFKSIDKGGNIYYECETI